MLLQRGAEGYMEARPANASWTAVHEAARNGHLACLRLLLRNGASPETVSRSGCNALMVAAAGSRAGHLECLRCLLGQAGMVAQRRAAARQELRAAVAAIADVVQLAKGVARRVEEWLPRRARAEEAEREVAAAAARQQSLFKREKLAVKTLKVAAHSTLLGYGGGSNNSPLLRWGFAAWTCLWLRGAAMRQKERYKHAAADNECGEFVLGIITLTKLTLTLTLTHGHHHMCVIWVVTTDDMHNTVCGHHCTRAAHQSQRELQQRLCVRMVPLLARKRAALEQRWAASAKDVLGRHLAALERGHRLVTAADANGWSSLHHAAAHGMRGALAALMMRRARSLLATTHH
eukprot:SAG25_NODE_592_length_6685_cov_34.632098_6_plen_347_part_00